MFLFKVYENQRATKDVVHRIRKIVAHFHRSGKATEELRFAKSISASLKNFAKSTPAQVDSRRRDEMEFHLLHAEAIHRTTPSHFTVFRRQ